MRYATTGEVALRNVQPLFADFEFGGLAICHNGNLTNSYHLRRQLVRRGSLFQSTSDTEVIIHLIAKVSEYGIGTLIYWLALISVNLGLFNLLPFPILDGGHLLFLAIEKVKGSPVDVRIQEIATTIAFFLIICLALFVTYHDVLRLRP